MTSVTTTASSLVPQTITLPDGRTLSYTTYGTPSSPLPPLIYLHGFPASRIEASLWSTTAQSLNLHIIAPDRPGMGHSSPHPSRTISSYAADISALTDALSIPQFRILGVSGGAPYVLACAKEIPSSRLLSCAIVSGLYPLTLGASGMIWGSRSLLFLASYTPTLVSYLLDWSLGRAARDPDPDSFSKLIMSEMKGRPAPDLACLESSPAFKAGFLASVRESLYQGSVGIAWEAKLFGCAWGFELTDVGFTPLTLWHGTLDVNSPVRMAREAAKMLKGAELKEFEDEAHVSLVVNHMEDILRQLVLG